MKVTKLIIGIIDYFFIKNKIIGLIILIPIILIIIIL